MDGWMGAGMDKGMDGWIQNGFRDGWMQGLIQDGWMDGCRNEWIGAGMVAGIDSGWMDGWTDAEMNAGMDECSNGCRMDAGMYSGGVQR